MIISLGGGYQLYTNQRTIGDGFGSQLDLVAAVGEFCRQRQERCHGADLVPQVALLHSSTAFYRTAPKLFDSLGQLNTLLGTLNCLLDSQQVVENPSRAPGRRSYRSVPAGRGPGVAGPAGRARCSSSRVRRERRAPSHYRRPGARAFRGASRH